MSCHAWHDLLQRHLDEDGPADELERHVAGCPDCAADWPAIARLLAGIRQLHPTPPPADLHARLVDSLLTEAHFASRTSQRRTMLSFVGLAAAAAVAITLGVWAWRPATEGPSAGVAEVKQPTPPTVAVQEPLRDSMEQASNAVAALTTRTASETVERTTLFVPLVKQAAPPLTEVPAALETPLERFREATQGGSAGLSPVGDSARRAVGLFLRDLPMGR
jgi:hypothetical protein